MFGEAWPPMSVPDLAPDDDDDDVCTNLFLALFSTCSSISIDLFFYLSVCMYKIVSCNISCLFSHINHLFFICLYVCASLYIYIYIYKRLTLSLYIYITLQKEMFAFTFKYLHFKLVICIKIRACFLCG